MTKEEIQAKIDTLVSLFGIADGEYDIAIQLRINKLKAKLNDAKSITDLQKEAFEAGRDIHWNKNISQGRIFEDDWIHTYETFEDYLNSKK